jgi:hypothetical protein
MKIKIIREHMNILSMYMLKSLWPYIGFGGKLYPGSYMASSPTVV